MKNGLPFQFVKCSKKMVLWFLLTFRKGLFTVGPLDNIDHNPSSTTAVGAFHGCGISLLTWVKVDFLLSSPQS